MSAKTTVVLLVLVAAACLVVIGLDQGWFGKGPAKEAPVNQFAPPAQAEAKDLFADHPAEVKRVTITSADWNATFAKTGQQWEIVEPIKAAALSWQVESLVRAVVDLKYSQRLEPGQPGTPSDAEMGLDQPTTTVTIDYEGGKATLQVGKQQPLQKQTYVRLAGRPEAYLVATDLKQALGKELKDFREKTLAQFRFDEAVELELVSREPAQTVRLTRQEGGDWVVEAPVKARAARERASELISAISEMQVEDFVEDDATDLAKFGLDEPFLSVTLTTRNEIKPQEKQPEGPEEAASQPTTEPTTQPQYEVKTTTLLIGRYVGLQRNRRYAKLADSGAVVAVNDSQVQKLVPELLELRDKRITPANTFKITKLIVTDWKESATVEKVDGQWQITAPEPMPAESTAVEELIRGIRQLEAAEFVDRPEDPGQYGLAEPQVELKFSVEGQVEPEIIRVGRKSPSGRMVYVQRVGEESVAVVRTADAEKVMVSAVAFAPRQVLQLPRAQIRQLELTRHNEPLVLEKQDWQWQITTPASGAADDTSVSNILSDLASLRARQVVAKGELGAYGLDPPEVRVVVAVAVPPRPTTTHATTEATTTQATQPAEQIEEEHRLLVGKRGEHVYAAVQGKGLVYQIDPIVYEHLTAELHDRRVLKFSPSQVAKLKISDSQTAQSLEFARAGQTWSYVPDPFFQVDAAKMDQWLQDLRGLQVQRFVAPAAEDLGTYGLTEPATRVEATLENGEAISLLISSKGPEEGEDRYGVVAGQNNVFVLSAAQVSKLRTGLGSFEKASPPQ